MPSQFMRERVYTRFPRAYADDLVAEGIVDAKDMLSKCLSWMSADDVREMLDANELSPRFAPEDEKFCQTCAAEDIIHCDCIEVDGEMIPASEATSADQF